MTLCTTFLCTAFLIKCFISVSGDCGITGSVPEDW